MPRISLTLLCALFVVACGGGGGDGGTTQQAAAVTQTIGAAGGTIAGPNGVQLNIPPGALSADTTITIAVDRAAAPPLPPDVASVGPTYSITPHGTGFSVPVELSVPFDPALLPTGEPPLLVKTRGDSWRQLVARLDGNTLSAAITELSYVSVRCCIASRLRFVDEPDDQTAPENGFAFFRGEAIGDNRFLRYQWLRNGFPLFGETNPEILIPHVTQAHDNSLYALRVTQAGGFSIESRAARLLVQPAPPEVVNEPIDTQVVEGQFARFNAASVSSVPQTLQWQVRRTGNSNFADLGLETATALSFMARAGDDGARYRMCASNAAGMDCSRGARLSVIPLPVQPVIAQQPQSLTVTASSSALFTVIATGGNLSYAWEHGRDGVNFTPHPTCGDSASCTMSNTALADDGTYLRVRVFNSVGSVRSAIVLLTVRLAPGAALVRIGAGTFSVGLRANGTLRAWGANSDGQLGDGTTDVRNDAVDVVGLSNVATFAAGFHHTLAIRANGEVWAWGSNRNGQLGDGTTTDRALAQAVPGLPPARAVAASTVDPGGFSLAVLADGTVRAWGGNRYGQLGDGTTTDRPTPVQVGTLSEVASVAAGDRHALALRRDGTLWAWGANTFGQLGNGTTTASVVPMSVPMPAPIVAIAAGGLSSLALSDQGTVYAWGFNLTGGLGDGSTEQRTAPVTVQLPAPAIAIAAAWDGHALALLADGRVFAWGYNEYGQCGLGTDTPAEATPRAVVAPLPPNIVAIGVGANHSLALDAAGDVWAWGNDSGGALNDGARGGQRETPVRVRNVNLN